MMLLIRGGLLNDPSLRLNDFRDLWIENGKIKAVDRPGSFDHLIGTSELKVIEAKGHIIAPGFFDVHVHLREPGLEYKETIASGTKAAILGGFTSVACMANTVPVNDHAITTRYILEKAREAGNARVFPIGAVTKGLKGEELAEIGMMIEAGVRALSDDGMPVMNSALMRKAMEYAATFDVPIISHAEDLNLSQGAPMNEGAVSALLGYRGNPAASEEIMVAREIALARLTGARVHIAHISTREGVDLVRRAKEAGLDVTAEVTPHHLIMNDRFLMECNHGCSHRHARADYKMAPPLRSPDHQEALIQALNDGVIDMVASDHAPHGCVDKETEFELAANGILGLQTTVPILLGLVHQKKLKIDRMIESLTTAPGKLFSHPVSLREGAIADLTILDPEKEWTLTAHQLASKSSNSPFLQRSFRGAAVGTIVAGEWKEMHL
jgi:dihydroorotase